MKVCVLGCGDIARAAHGPALMRLRDEGLCQLAGCCARRIERAESYKNLFGFEHAYSDYSKMLNDLDPDVALILLPVKMIAEISVDVLEKGVPIITEKPPGTSVEETDMIASTAERTGLFNAVTFNRRFMPLVQMLKQNLENKRIDAVSLELCRWKRTGEDFTTTAIHGIDCLSFLVGAPYEEMRCRYQENDSRSNVNYLVSGSFKNGVLFDARFMPDAGAVTERISVFAEGYQYYLKLPVWSGTEYTNGFDFPGSLQCVYNQKTEYEISGDKLSGCLDGFVLNGFYTENKVLISALRDGKDSPHPVSSGRQAVEISALLRNRIEYKRWEVPNEK